MDWFWVLNSVDDRLLLHYSNDSDSADGVSVYSSSIDEILDTVRIPSEMSEKLAVYPRREIRRFRCTVRVLFGHLLLRDVASLVTRYMH